MLDHPAFHVLLLTLLAACAAPPLDVASRVTPPAERDEPPAQRPELAEARALIDFWRAAGPALWFAKDAAFDRSFRERFAEAHARAARGELSAWADTADGTLALILLLDQYPRNAFRGTPRMYATDAAARELAGHAVEAGFDRQVEPALQVFVILPFGHSELLADQERAVELSGRLGPPHLEHAEHHRDIVRRFGRFPHRNAILGRASTQAERHYLDDAGYQG
jgi:uncharacterized protein (DUF924 family)